jgi:hypothetical protein
LAFKSSRCFFQTSVATNVVGVINVFYLFGAGEALSGRDWSSESVRQELRKNCLFLDTARQECL